jgi:hypothetical protein
VPEELETPLTEEERLQALLYQYIALYERWSEDRQVAAKRGADHAELLRNFAAQVEQFKALAPEVRNDLKKSLSQELANALVRISDPLKAEAAQSVGSFVKDLGKSVFEAKEALRYCKAAYTREMAQRQWKIIGAVLIASVCISVLAIKLFAHPGLTEREITLMNEGQISEKVLLRLGSQERDYWMKLMNEVVKEEKLSY